MPSNILFNMSLCGRMLATAKPIHRNQIVSILVPHDEAVNAMKPIMQLEAPRQETFYSESVLFPGGE